MGECKRGRKNLRDGRRKRASTDELAPLKEERELARGQLQRAIDETCGSADPDCGRDHCADYGLYANGTCDPHCPTPDPDCSAGPSVPPSGCTPTHFRLDPWTGQCSYLDACGVACGVRMAQCDPYYGCRC